MTKSSYLFNSLFLALAVSQSLTAQISTPEQYTCLSTNGTLIIDGKLDEKDWLNASWTNDFVDIEGVKRPAPTYRTRAKMLWDENYFYVAAEIEEPHLWATYDQRDMVIFHENDFEVFIDPDGDTHQYYELEINALGTVWDLMLIKPYRDGGPAIDAWDIAGLKKGIKLNGTLNDPSDIDQGWTVELALPWNILEEAASGSKKPKAGDTWRVNFSRVNWRTENSNGTYTKQVNPTTGKPYPESNWVWSPQGVIAMHQPETWGYVTFADQPTQQTYRPKGTSEQYALREIYLMQKAYYEKNQAYAKNLSELEGKQKLKKEISLHTTPSMFEAIIETGQTVWHINHEGRIWTTTKKI